MKKSLKKCVPGAKDVKSMINTLDFEPGTGPFSFIQNGIVLRGNNGNFSKRLNQGIHRAVGPIVSTILGKQISESLNNNN
jgi:hypothetical protein